MITSHKDKNILTLQVKVSNYNNQPNPQTVLLFLSPPVQDNAPLKSLRNFSRIVISPNSSTTLKFNLSQKDFCVPNSDGVCDVISGEWKIQVGDLVTVLKVSRDFEY